MEEIKIKIDSTAKTCVDLMCKEWDITIDHFIDNALKQHVMYYRASEADQEIIKAVLRKPYESTKS